MKTKYTNLCFCDSTSICIYCVDCVDYKVINKKEGFWNGYFREK